jgi:hypothetical protein
MGKHESTIALTQGATSSKCSLMHTDGAWSQLAMCTANPRPMRGMHLSKEERLVNPRWTN